MRKVLWVRVPQADNHVDETFLGGLRHNRNIGSYRYRTLVGDSSVVVLNLALTCLFASAFLAIYRENWDPKWFAVGAAPFHIALSLRWLPTWPQRVGAAKSLVLTGFAVMALAPVFRSLTESTSSDSIWAIATWLCVANIAFSTRPSTIPVSASTGAQKGPGILVLSINTALAATIVLASRLPSSRRVFYFIAFSIETFVALPTIARWLRTDKGTHAPMWYVILSTMVIAVSSGLVGVQFGAVVLAVYLGSLGVILLGIPLLFLGLQKHKDQIEGPWDPAIPIMS